MKGRIVIGGGSGFVGSHLSRQLVAADYEVVVLSRSAKSIGGLRKVVWDGKTIGPWAAEIDGALVLINLAGKSINCRHTVKNRLKILQSRVDSVRVLGEALARAAHPPPLYIQASAVGIYGDAGNEICTESSPHGLDYIAQVCDQWEEAFAAVSAPNVRKVLLRFGIVLGRDGGFLPVMRRLARFYLGGQAGDGEQFISWIHIRDLCSMFLAAIDYPEISGIYNACSPNPAKNKDFMDTLRAVLHRPWSPRVPEIAVRIGSWLMGTDGKLALMSQRAIPEHFLRQEFPFAFAALRPALEDLLNSPRERGLAIE